LTQIWVETTQHFLECEDRFPSAIVFSFLH